MGLFKDVIQRISIKDKPYKYSGNPNDIKDLLGITGPMISGEEYFRKQWIKHSTKNGFAIMGTDPYKEEDMNDKYYNQRTFPNQEMLKSVFPMQNEYVRYFEPHADNFELELKKFFAFGRRASGRSTMLARVLVETAIESGRPIKLVDHYIDDTSNNAELSHLHRNIRTVIDNYRRNEVYIEIIKDTRKSIQLYLSPDYFDAYHKIRIENNPTKFEVFDNNAIKKQIEKLKRRRLLLI